MKTLFGNLRESNDFLNLLLDNIDAAVLIADEDLRVQQFNKTFEYLFDASQERGSGDAFGSLTGCKHQVEEGAACGLTSRCHACALRLALVKTMLEQAPVDRQNLEKTFYLRGLPITRHLQFSTRPISYQGRSMILIIIHDVTYLELARRDLLEKQRLLDQDLAAAAGIQRTLLPENGPRLPFAGAAWAFEPSGRIGGDVFNIHFQNQDTFAAYMMDVCGHGVTAALISVAVSQFLQTLRARYAQRPEWFTPKNVFARLEETFPFERFDSFFSMAYVRIDAERGALVHGLAGHPPVFLLRKGAPARVLAARGPVIGTGFGASHAEESEPLEPGDRIVLHTDGLTEALGSGGGSFGQAKLLEILEQGMDLDNAEMVRRVNAALREFTGEGGLADDMSLFSVEYFGLSRGRHNEWM